MTVAANRAEMVSLASGYGKFLGLNKKTFQGLQDYAIGSLMALLLFLSTPAGAASDDDSGLRASIEQRISLTRNYLESDTAAKIAASENPQARRLLEKSRELLDQASAALRQGKLLAAQDKVNLSLQSFTAAGTANLRKAPDPAAAQRELGSLRIEIDSYLQAFSAALAEKGPSMAGLLDRQYFDGLLANAQQAESIEDYANAKASLARAKQAVVDALIKIRHNETVVYSVEFQTPADEFRYENDRYREYAALGQKLLDSGELEESRTKMYEQLKKSGDSLADEAAELAGAGDYQNAIARMEAAVRKLVQGLQLLGVPLSM